MPWSEDRAGRSVSMPVRMRWHGTFHAHAGLRLALNTANVGTRSHSSTWVIAGMDTASASRVARCGRDVPRPIAYYGANRTRSCSLKSRSGTYLLPRRIEVTVPARSKVKATGSP